MPEIFFRVIGDPKPQAKKQAFARKLANGKWFARVADAKTAEGWKNAIAISGRPFVPAKPIAGPVKLEVDFFFARPGRLMRRKDPTGRMPHPAKPDRDNCEKALQDTLKILGFFVDDAQVCAGEVRKFYVALGEQPGAEIRISWEDDVRPGLVPPARKPQPRAEARF